MLHVVLGHRRSTPQCSGLMNCAAFTQVVPQKYGTAKPFWFLVQRSFWQSAPPEHTAVVKVHPFKPTPDAGNSDIQDEDSPGKPGISTHQLRKVYSGADGTQIVALQSLEMAFYEGQITVLLGHNGAGSLLLSLLSPLLSHSCQVCCTFRQVNDHWNANGSATPHIRDGHSWRVQYYWADEPGKGKHRTLPTA